MEHCTDQGQPTEHHYGRFLREADMLMPIIAQRMHLLPQNVTDWETFFEIQTMHGVVDMLFVVPNTDALAKREAVGLPAVTDSAQVATLLGLTALGAIHGQACSGASAASLASFVPVSSNHLKRRVLPELVSSGWITKLDGDTWVASYEYETPLKQIIAVEVKRSEWRRALSQAIPHTDFADAAFVALDAGRLPSVTKLKPAFSYAGIGLIAVTSRADQGSYSASPELAIIIRPQYHCQSGLIRAVVAERVAALRAAGIPSGPVGHVFGRFITTSAGSTDPRMLHSRL